MSGNQRQCQARYPENREVMRQFCGYLRCCAAISSNETGGEGGIRTLGPPQGGQRFSRPPRSTAPAPLHANGGEELAQAAAEHQANAWHSRWHRLGAILAQKIGRRASPDTTGALPPPASRVPPAAPEAAAGRAEEQRIRQHHCRANMRRIKPGERRRNGGADGDNPPVRQIGAMWASNRRPPCVAKAVRRHRRFR